MLLTSTYQYTIHNIKWEVTNNLLPIAYEPIGLIILFTSWLTSNILPLPVNAKWTSLTSCHYIHIPLETSIIAAPNTSPSPAHAAHTPHTWNPPVYGANTQYIEETEDSPSLSRKEVNCLQQLGGMLLHYKRAVDPTLIMSVNVLAPKQTRETAETAEKINKSLNYCTIHTEATLRYHASDMI
jgi:hypothetical protein